MKVLSRDFTLKESIFILILTIFLLGFVYYYFVDNPVRTTIANCEQEMSSVQTTISTLELQLQKLESMQKEIESVMSTGSLAEMPSYNNHKAEIKMVNDIMAASETYNVVFDDVTRDGDQIRRNVRLYFTAKNYATAKSILNELSNSDYRCILGDVAISSTGNNLKNGEVSVSLVATFFETMVDGVADSGLPASEGDSGVELNYVDDSTYYYN